MKAIKRKHCYIDREFEKNLIKLYPSQKSLYQRTKQLNKIIEKVLYQKKASINDIFYVLTGFFALALVIIFIYVFVSKANDQFQTVDSMTAEAKETSSTMTSFIPASLDFGGLILFIGLLVCILILASLVPVHPVFLIFYMIILLIAIMFGGWISNSYEMISTNATIATEVSQFQWLAILFRYLPYVVGVFGIILMVVMYKVWGGSQNV